MRASIAGRGASAADDGGVVLVHHHPPCAPEHFEARAFQLQAQFFGDDLPAGQDGDVLQHRFAAIAKARRLDRAVLERAAQMIDDERGQRFAFDVFRHDQQRAPRICDGVEQGKHVLERGEFSIEEQHVRVFEHGLHLFRVGDEIVGNEPPVEAHALDDFEGGLGRFRFLDGDDAVVAHLLHGLGDELADDGVIVGGDGGDLRLFLSGLHRAGHGAQGVRGGRRGPVQAALQIDGAGPGDDVAHAVGEDRVRQDSRRAGSVADGFACLFSRLPQHPGAEIFFRVLQLQFLGDGHAVVADERGAPFLFDQHRFGTGAQRDADGVGKLRGAAQDLVAGG